jgi:hypothetical protein
MAKGNKNPKKIRREVAVGKATARPAAMEFGE